MAKDPEEYIFEDVLPPTADEKQDYLEKAKQHMDGIGIYKTTDGAGVFALIALVERLDTMNDKLERIASRLDDALEQGLPIRS
jgi:hypothetical protein